VTVHNAVVRGEPDGVVLKTEIEGAHAVLSLGGELDLARRAEIVMSVTGLVADGVTNLVIDLSEVSFMDSSGLSALLEARRLGADLSLRNPSDRVRRLLDVVMIESLIPIEPV
jgi:anti-anti-sigma factor